jgi:hypothetical protein
VPAKGQAAGQPGRLISDGTGNDYAKQFLIFRVWHAICSETLGQGERRRQARRFRWMKNPMARIGRLDAPGLGQKVIFLKTCTTRRRHQHFGRIHMDLIGSRNRGDRAGTELNVSPGNAKLR